jgi:hypothetical protein
MKIECGASLLHLEGFDRDHLPVLLWTREWPTPPRIGDRVTSVHQETGLTVIMRVEAVDWLVDSEPWDVAVSGPVIEVYGDEDLTLEDFAVRLGVPRMVTH